MDRVHVADEFGQAAMHLVGAPLRAAEDNRLPRVFPLDQFDQQLELPLRVDGEVELIDRFHGQFVGGKVEHFRVAHVALGQPFDRRGNGGAQQQRLPRLRAAAEDLFDVGPETDVQHPIGLVEDHEAEQARTNDPRPIRSNTRPGVPTTMSHPRRSSWTCLRSGLPP